MREALDDELTVEREVDDDRYRLLATEAGGGVVVVGESLDDRDEAVGSLGALLLIGGPILLLLTAAVGYGATAAALRPVERMRARAAEIEATDRGARLPVPPADDEIGRLGRDAQRDARPHRGGVRARADVRRRRQPRAPHAAGDPQDRARAGAAAAGARTRS